ncbi:proline-rich protein 3-like [Camellia sinensis]|uniref:proline-rich protein 3-like n=1 Tax=Camellia sinensis TaxID=4442 RepID=UPI00103693E0|nr:proline-rich protein 3-like [Camellia sinensis]
MLEKPKTGGYEFVPKPQLDKPKTNGYGYASKRELEKPMTQGKLLPCITGIQGLIYCKSGPKLIPLEVSPYELEDAWKLTECKVLLEKSPLETCKVPADVNKGISGAPLSSFRLLKDENIKLYSVGPFFYTSEPKPVF